MNIDNGIIKKYFKSNKSNGLFLSFFNQVASIHIQHFD